MIKIPAHILSLAPYKPGKPGANMFGDIVPEMEVVLSSNENNFGPSPLAMEALAQSIPQMFLYPDPTAQLLKDKLSDLLDVPSENILVSNGSDAILYTMFKAFICPGESLLTAKGAFVSAHVMSAMNDVPVHQIPMADGYQFNLDAIVNAIDDTTKLIYLVNPNNPTGTMISDADMRTFLSKVPSHILVVVDEAYFEFAQALSPDYPDCSKLGYENVIVLRTFSKAYGLAGLRLGYAIGAPYLIDALRKVRLTFDPNLPAQIAGAAALDDKDFLEKTISNNTSQMQYLTAAYRSMGLNFIPSYGNFIMIDMGSEEMVESMYEYLRINGILTRRLASFGLPHCIRISIGRPEENEYLVKQLQNFVAQ